ncbi:MAG: type VI secretion system protein TssA [Polyangiaceae bacterium]|nr:type VI secretion system protein TssA [Polyangiaceae bacterium]
MAESLEQLVARVAPLKAPIEGAIPVGADTSYDADFGVIKTEIDKLAAMSGVAPNWKAVIEGCTELTTSKTKDLRLLVWLAVARLHDAGLPGLLEGMVAVKEVAGEHWEAMHPPAKRARARGALAGWFSDQVAAQIKPKKFGHPDAEVLRAVEVYANDLDTFFAEKLADSYPGMGALRSELRGKVQELPPAAAAAPTQSAAPAASPPPATTAAAPSGDSSIAVAPAPIVGGEQDVLNALRSVSKTILDCAEALRKADPAKAWAYRLQRLGLWLVVQQAPPNEGGKTKIRGPGDAVKRLETMQSAEQWLPLLLACESMSNSSIFWLDLQRLSALAMDRLGALFIPAREIVGREVVTFLERFPAIPDLAFADGTPFANPATRAWLKEETTKHAGGSGGGGSSRLSEEDEEIAKRFAEAKDLVAKGKVADGLALGAQLATRGADGRMRFRSRLTVAKLALQGSKPEVARPLFRALQAECERYQLDDWEPNLAAEVYAGLLASAAPKEDTGLAFERLCRLDPAAALKGGQ